MADSGKVEMSTIPSKDSGTYGWETAVRYVSLAVILLLVLAVVTFVAFAAAALAVLGWLIPGGWWTGLVAAGVAAAHGMTAEVGLSESYPATVNDDAEYALAVETVADMFGEDRYSEMPRPEMGSEDMSFVMEKVPGAYVFVSACPAEDYEAAPDNHSPRAAFDDSVVPDAAAWLAEVAVRRLRRER